MTESNIEKILEEVEVSVKSFREKYTNFNLTEDSFSRFEVEYIRLITYLVQLRTDYPIHRDVCEGFLDEMSALYWGIKNCHDVLFGRYRATSDIIMDIIKGEKEHLKKFL